MCKYTAMGVDELDGRDNSSDIVPDVEHSFSDASFVMQDLDRSVPGAAPVVPTGDSAVGSMLLNRYKIISALGKGGMGIVYKCFDEVAFIEVAVKTLAPELSGSMWEMESIRENFRLVHNLNHPNIASYNTLERDNVNGIYYLVMEYVDGLDLRYYLRNQKNSGNFSEQSVLKIVMQIADALDYAHSRKVLHRDIKPGNIMVDREGVVKLLDFGLAAEIHSSLSRVSMKKTDISGTLPYISPEQWRCKVQTSASDQYALAVAVYEIFAGHPPFENPDSIVLRECVLNEEADPLNDVSDKLWNALKRALSKDPAARFASCREFVSAMQGAAVSEVPTQFQTKKNSTPKKNNSNGAHHPLLRRAKILLENEEYRKALEFCEQTLNMEPENPWAYFYRLLAELELHDPMDLVKVKTLDMQKSFRLASRFADDDLRAQLESIFEQQQLYNNSSAENTASTASCEGISIDSYTYNQEPVTVSADTVNAQYSIAEQQYNNSNNNAEQAEIARIESIYQQAMNRIEMLKYYRQLLEQIPGKKSECKQIEVLIANEQTLLKTVAPSDSYAAQIYNISRNFCQMVGTIDELKYDIEHGVSAQRFERQKIKKVLFFFGIIVLLIVLFIFICAVNNKKAGQGKVRHAHAAVEKYIWSISQRC